MSAAVRCVSIICIGWLPATVWAQSKSDGPAKTTLCEIAAHPDTFERKLVQLRAIVTTGVDDLPAGVADDSCAAELKFFLPDEQHLSQLLKSREFRKLTKDVKKHPVVEATVTGWIRRNGLVLQSVERPVVKPDAKR